MTTILRSDLFRNFMGGFVIGAVALFAMQPQDSRARIGQDISTTSAGTESHSIL
jgi:hypothetical protein